MTDMITPILLLLSLVFSNIMCSSYSKTRSRKLHPNNTLDKLQYIHEVFDAYDTISYHTCTVQDTTHKYIVFDCVLHVDFNDNTTNSEGVHYMNV